MLRREKGVPEELLAYFKREQEAETSMRFDGLNHFISYPEREVKMKILRNGMEQFCPVIIPAVDVFTRGDSPMIRRGYFKRDSLAFFVSGTHQAFPFGHVYRSSGSICLGNLFVPSAVPWRFPTIPLETLFLSNDRNTNHGGGCLTVSAEKNAEIENLLKNADIHLSVMESRICVNQNLLKSDQIWNMSADVAEQKPLPEALSLMKQIYTVIFKED